MAQTSDSRTRPWIAFVAGAVAMLAVGLIWLAWTRTHDAARVVRADVALPAADLPSIPTAPPPEGPQMPQLPVPTPK